MTDAERMMMENVEALAELYEDILGGEENEGSCSIYCASSGLKKTCDSAPCAVSTNSILGKGKWTDC